MHVIHNENDIMVICFVLDSILYGVCHGSYHIKTHSDDDVASDLSW